MNFGIPPEIRQRFIAMLNEDGETSYEVAAAYFDTVPATMLLKLYRYFSWVNQRLYTHFFLENKDKITDDLLADFREETTENVIDQKQIFGGKPKGLKQETGLLSHHEFLFGTAVGDKKHDVVDIND